MFIYYTRDNYTLRAAKYGIVFVFILIGARERIEQCTKNITNRRRTRIQWNKFCRISCFNVDSNFITFTILKKKKKKKKKSRTRVLGVGILEVSLRKWFVVVLCWERRRRRRRRIFIVISNVRILIDRFAFKILIKKQGINFRNMFHLFDF